MIDLSFDNGTIEQYTLVLSQRDFTHLGLLSNVQHVKLKINLNAANELSFDVYKELDGHEEALWDDIYDLRLVWISELDEYYEINVTSTDKVYVTKTITAKSLCESELSQTYLNKVEINTAADIARDDYDANYPTVFYRPLDGLDTETDEYKIKKNASLMHRIMEKVPAYSIGHIDASLYNQQRVFSISNTTLYNFLTGDCAKQFNCLFKFDSATRTISAYDLETVCKDCGHRGFFNDICPECGSTDLKYYGDDTTVFVSTENLTDEVKFETDVNSMKNCFRLEAGDDDMTAAVINSNPNGTRYIYEFNQETLNDMPEQLRELISNYDALYEYYYNEAPISLGTNLINSYNNLCTKYNDPTYHHVDNWKTLPNQIIGYKNLMPYYYNCIDFYSYLKSSMMPDPVEEIYSIEAEAQHIQAGINSLTYKEGNVNLYRVIAMHTPPHTNETVESAITNICQIFINTGAYNVTTKLQGNIYDAQEIEKGGKVDHWIAKARAIITLTSNEDDTISTTISYTGSNYLNLTTDYGAYMEQNITKLLKRDKDAVDIYDVLTMPWNKETGGSEFYIELAKYSSARLESFKNALDAVLGVLVEAGQGQATVINKDYGDPIQNPTDVAYKINPHIQNWYEKSSDNSYVLTEDTRINNTSKKYYTKVVGHGFRQINLSAVYDPARRIIPVALGWYEDYQSYETAEKKPTNDTEVIPGKKYYKKNKYNAYTRVKVDTINPRSRGWFEDVSGKKSKIDKTVTVYEGSTFHITSDEIVNYNKKYWEYVSYDDYTKVKIPVVNPKKQNWFEQIRDIAYGTYKYVPTEDTTVVNNKNYYIETVTTDAPPLYESFYVPYKAKAEAVTKELDERNGEIKIIAGSQSADGSYNSKGILQYIVDCISEIQSNLDFRKYIFNNTFDRIIAPTGNPKTQQWYEKRIQNNHVEYVATTDTTVVLGKTYYQHNYSYDLHDLYTTYIREDTYNNSNYISNDLTNDKLFENAGIFLETAKDELHKSANYQHSISTNINNLMAIPEFKPLLNNFELGNWIRVKEDDTIYRLRLISYSIDFDDISQLNTEFSDVTVTADGLNDIKSILNQATTMATSYSYTQQQAETGADVMYNYIDDWVTNGLNSALVRINSNTDEDISIDNAGITARTYDDVMDEYGPEQLRVTHNMLAFTEDNWKTVSTGLGKFDFTHHIFKDNGASVSSNTQTDPMYGLVAKAVLSGWINGTRIEGGTIIASHIQNIGNGNYMDLGSNTTDSDLRYFLKCGSDFSVSKSGEIMAKKGNVGGVILSPSEETFGGINLDDYGNLYIQFTNVNGQFTENQVGQGAVNFSKLSGSIAAAQIVGRVVAAENIVSNSITANELSTNAIKSRNYPTTPQTGTYSSTGTFLDLSNGSIKSPNFAITETGAAYFKGDVTANAGYIGGTSGWAIKTGYMTTPSTTGPTTVDETSKTGTYVGSGGILNSNGSSYIKLKGGTLTANNVNILGGHLKVGSKFEVASADGKLTCSDIQINSGTITIGSGFFASASAVSVKGTITATGGTIGNCSITNGNLEVSGGHIIGGTIKSANYEHDEGETYSNAGSAFSLTTGVIRTPNFCVSSSGNAYIRGRITASSGSITGVLTMGANGYIGQSSGDMKGLRIGNGSLGISASRGSKSWTGLAFGEEASEKTGWSNACCVLWNGGDSGGGFHVISGAPSEGNTGNFSAVKQSSFELWANESRAYTYDTGGGHSGSDKRIKHDIVSLSFNKIRDFFTYINPVSFRYNRDNLMSFGIIAQELENALEKASMKNDNIIKTYEDDEESIKYVAYQEFHGIELAGIKDLYEIVKEQQSQIDELKQQIERLKGE